MEYSKNLQNGALEHFGMNYAFKKKFGHKTFMQIEAGTSHYYFL